MRANFETQRRFLVDNLPKELLESPAIEKMEGHLNDEGSLIRVTLNADINDVSNLSSEQIVCGFVGVNRKVTSPDLIEEDLEVNKQRALSLLNSCVGSVIRKTQYKLEYDGLQWTVNIYGGHLSGLKVAEVRHPISKMHSVKLPSFIRREITSQTLLSESVLSRVDKLETIWSMIYNYKNRIF